MCGVQERIYSIFFSGNLSSTQFVSVTAVLQFFYIDSSIARVIDSSMLWFNVQISSICWNWFNFFETDFIF